MNVRFKFRQLVLLGSTLGLMVGFQNCAKTSFSSGADNSTNGVLDTPNPDPNSCYNYLHQVSTPIKLLFVVDESGSNQSGDQGAPGTDPDKSARGGSIQRFFDDYKSKANFNWGMIGFSDHSARSYIGSSFSPMFTANVMTMQTAVNTFLNNQDAGGTPYGAALDEVNLMISDDTGATSDTRYIVVFLSDGVPNPVVSDSELNSDINAIMNLRPGHITFNTVFYGAADPDASSRLSMMAHVGQGYFLDVNANPSGKDFLISNVVDVPGSTCTP